MHFITGGAFNGKTGMGKRIYYIKFSSNQLLDMTETPQTIS